MLDTTFDNDGIVTADFDPVNSVLIQADGKIITAGEQNISRFNTDGSPDTTFATNSTLETSSSISKAIFTSDGKILAGGNLYFVRCNIDGHT